MLKEILFSNEKVSPGGIVYDARLITEGQVELMCLEVQLNVAALERYAPTLSEKFDVALTRARTPEQQDKILALRDRAGERVREYVEKQREDGNLNFF